MVAGVNGGKVRSCYHLATTPNVPKGLVTAGARSSPQANIVAHIARELGIPCRIHMPSGELQEQGELAREAGAEIVQHKPGYNTVIVKRARDDAAVRGWREIPFGMECAAAVGQTATQITSDMQDKFGRIVVPVGSGMTLCGILHGLRVTGQTSIPVVGVAVGADPTKRLDRYAPIGWRHNVTLVTPEEKYHEEAFGPHDVEGVSVDPIYEAKCIPYLKRGDLFWIVGSRNRRT